MKADPMKKRETIAAAFFDHALCGEDAEAATATTVDGAGGSVRKEAV